MTQEQIEAKALELFPVRLPATAFGYPISEQDQNEKERAAFIKGCQYAATPSGVNREDAEKWIEARYPKGEDEHIAQLINGAGRKGGMAMYGYLASLYPAQPGYSEQQVREAIDNAQLKNTMDGTYRYDAPMLYTPDEIIELLNHKK